MSSIDDGPKIRKVLWRRLQSTFDEWGLSQEERIALLGVHKEAFESWQIAEWISPDGAWWNRAVGLVGIHYALIDYLGSEDQEEIRRWLRTPNNEKVLSKIFEGTRPLEKMTAEKHGSYATLAAIIKYLKLVKK